MGKHQYCQGMGLLHISRETVIRTILKLWEKWITIVRETHGKTQTFQNYGFLTYFVWINTISKTWGKWVPIVRKNTGKHKHFKGFLAEIHTIPKTWEKLIPIIRESMGKYKYSKVLVFKYFESQINKTSKTREKLIPVARETYGKTSILSRYGFIAYFAWNSNPYNSEIMGKVNYHSKGNAWENTNIPKLWVSYILRVNQYNFQNMGKVSSHSKEKYGKTQAF